MHFDSMLIPNDDEYLSLLQMRTINDVLFGIISAGLFKYLDHRSPNGKKGIAFPTIHSIFVNSKATNLNWLKCSLTFVSCDLHSRSGDG